MSLSYVLGLGHSGLSIIAYLQRLGKAVKVFDNRQTPPGLETLRKKWPKITIELGPWQAESLLDAQQIIISPGLSPTDPALALARAAGIPIIGDIECFVKAATAPIIAITGTNAKGTVTTLIADMLTASGLKVLVGGNIGVPALDLLLEPTPDYYVLELSSFQLETTFSLKAHACVLLNISEDHLDRHGSMAHYLCAKQRIFQGAQHIIINRDQAVTWPSCPSELFSFGKSAPQSPNELGLRTIDDRVFLAFGAENLIAIDQLKVKGIHNALNALAALALGFSLSIPLKPMLSALQQFCGLEHRCQFIDTVAGVHWYNDSKATNVGATLAALEGLGASGKIVLIAGGQAKGQDFSPLLQAVKNHCRTVILFGQDAPLLTALLTGSVPLIQVENLSEAVGEARDISEQGDSVLLSPACASLDMFNNFEDRGRQFVALVNTHSH
jgi:UDP-N-acetylmuramoylalanine--D-glutamate ligase